MALVKVAVGAGGGPVPSGRPLIGGCWRYHRVVEILGSPWEVMKAYH